MAGKINPDLQGERDKSNLDQTCRLEITHLKEGGPNGTAKRKEIGVFLVDYKIGLCVYVMPWYLQNKCMCTVYFAH